MLRELEPSVHRRDSGASSSSGGVVDLRAAADCPRLLAKTDALWLARVAVMAAFTRFRGRGLALSVRARSRAVEAPCRMGSRMAVLGGGGASGGDGAGAVTVIAATPVVGVAGGEQLSPASLLLSSLCLALLARSRLLLPEWFAWVSVAWVLVATLPPAAVGRNQRVISSVFPSISNTNLAGIPPLLQRTHAMYWLCAHGGGREPV